MWEIRWMEKLMCFFPIRSWDQQWASTMDVYSPRLILLIIQWAKVVDHTFGQSTSAADLILQIPYMRNSPAPIGSFGTVVQISVLLKQNFSTVMLAKALGSERQLLQISDLPLMDFTIGYVFDFVNYRCHWTISSDQARHFSVCCQNRGVTESSSLILLHSTYCLVRVSIHLLPHQDCPLIFTVLLFSATIHKKIQM